ncbi:hypothetical protein [Streptomyces natalensis]|uniref:hypothetical protein n=1 Tax=Streptomyces natalensis TaxID=68242 RepID=UPI000AF52958|nr:hypothetical protein [Streptomyces natalensis]
MLRPLALGAVLLTVFAETHPLWDQWAQKSRDAYPDGTPVEETEPRPGSRR